MTFAPIASTRLAAIAEGRFDGEVVPIVVDPVPTRCSQVNPNDGGTSLGHPLGATGARITATLVNELERRKARYGIATMGIGHGQALACVIESLAR